MCAVACCKNQSRLVYKASFDMRLQFLADADELQQVATGIGRFGYAAGFKLTGNTVVLRQLQKLVVDVQCPDT